MKDNQEKLMKIKVNIPKELTNLVLEKDVKILGTGYFILDKKSKGEKYELWRKYDFLAFIIALKVSKEYIEQRNLKGSDKIAFVEYPLNGKQTLDIFKIEG